MNVFHVQQEHPVPRTSVSGLVDLILKDSILQNECVY